MKRQDKYPDTSTFHYYNANPKNRITTDCVIRAICTGTGLEYGQVVMDLAKLQIKTGHDMSEATCYGKYLESLGWEKMKQPRKDDNTKFTGREFCNELQHCNSSVRKYGYDMDRIIAHLGGKHVVAIMSGKVWDHWNSTGGCIGNYWIKPVR